MQICLFAIFVTPKSIRVAPLQSLADICTGAKTLSQLTRVLLAEVERDDTLDALLQLSYSKQVSFFFGLFRATFFPISVLFFVGDFPVQIAPKSSAEVLFNAPKSKKATVCIMKKCVG